VYVSVTIDLDKGVSMSQRTFWTALALVAGMTVAGATGAPPAAHATGADHIENDTQWIDAAGNPILAQGGNVQKAGATWYWVGSALVAGQPKSINLYSSTDLTNWTFVKSLVTQWGGTGTSPVPGDTAANDPAGDQFVSGQWLGRPQLIHNTAHHQWVLWAEVGSHTGAKGNAQAVFTTADDDIAGTYTLRSQPNDPALGNQDYLVQDQAGNLVTSGDRSVFVDGDNAYLVYVGDSTTQRNQSVNIAPLDDTWTKVGAPIWTLPFGGQEAPGLVRVGTTYYLFASGQKGWDPTQTVFKTSSTTLKGFPTAAGTWTPVTEAPSSGTQNSFATQFEQIIPVTDSNGVVQSYLYNGDRYSEFADQAQVPGSLSGVGRNAFYPIAFDGGTPKLFGATDVSVNASSGTLNWNRVVNGRFDMTGAINGKVPYWTSSGTSGATTIAKRTGSNAQELVQTGTAFTSWNSQTISLPNGSYRAEVWYRLAGTPQNAYLGIKANDVTNPSAEIRTAFTTGGSTFTTTTVDFSVTSGKVTIGSWIDATGSATLETDAYSIWSR
jgi:hypothetical protein